MSSFLSKLRVTVLGNVHDLLDKAIDMNSPSALRQYVRDLEDALDKMRNEAAVQAGQEFRTLDRERTDIEVKIEQYKAIIKKLLGGTAPNKEELARAKATLVVQLNTELQSKVDSLAAQKTTSDGLDKAVTQLEIKHNTMVQRVRELERLDHDSKAKEQAASALQAAGKLVQGGADLSVDDLQAKMRARNDVASEKLNRAMGSISVATEAEDPTVTSDVDDLLSSLR